MTNVNDDAIPISNGPLPTGFTRWAFDISLDDEEFRAGYPFSSGDESSLIGLTFSAQQLTAASLRLYVDENELYDFSLTSDQNHAQTNTLHTGERI
jgi:hypothetical protein